MIRLEAPTKELYELMFRWFNSKEAWRIRQVSSPITWDAFMNMMMLWNEPNGLLFGISKDNHIIGYIAFSNWDRRCKRADYHLYISRNHRHKGYGEDVVKLSLDVFFKDYPMNKLRAFIPEYNKDVIEFCRSFGIRQEGILKKDGYTRGKYTDILVFGLLREEYIDMLNRKEEEEYIEEVTENEEDEEENLELLNKE